MFASSSLGLARESPLSSDFFNLLSSIAQCLCYCGAMLGFVNCSMPKGVRFGIFKACILRGHCLDLAVRKWRWFFLHIWSALYGCLLWLFGRLSSFIQASQLQCSMRWSSPLLQVDSRIFDNLEIGGKCSILSDSRSGMSGIPFRVWSFSLFTWLFTLNFRFARVSLGYVGLPIQDEAASDDRRHALGEGLILLLDERDITKIEPLLKRKFVWRIIAMSREKFCFLSVLCAFVVIF